MPHLHAIVRSRRAQLTLGLALPCVIGSWLLLHATQWGLFLGGDSASYVDLARNLQAGNGPVLTDFGASAPTFSAHFPPGYPALLAITGAAHDFAIARWLHVVLFCFTGALVGLLTHRATRSLLVATLAAGVVVWHPDTQAVFGELLSEALFMPLLLAGLLLMIRRRTTSAGGVIGLVWFTRHTGVALAAPLLLNLRRRPWKTGIALILAILPYGLWRAWARWHGPTSSRELRWHPPAWDEWQAALRTFGGWLLPTAGANERAWLGVGCLLLLVIIAWRVLRRPQRVGLIALISGSAFITLTLAARLVFDEAIPLQGRIWLPALPIFVVTAASAWRRQPRVLAVVLAVAAAAGAVEGARQAQAFSETGVGYASAAWRNSETLDYIQTLPPETSIHTNAPDAIGLLLDRPARPLPTTVFRTVGRPNTAWRRQLRAAAIELRDAGGVIVYFDAVDRSSYLVSEAQLHEYLVVEPVQTLPDGRIYRVVTVR